MPAKALTYKAAGHDLDRSDAIIEKLKTKLPHIGGFGGAFPLPQTAGGQILVSGTDGVGTKLLVAIQAKKHDTVGIDLVAMVVNDIVVLGAKPLFFLDYIGMGQLDPGVFDQIISGIMEGCRQAGCVLIGGETAELAGMYAKGIYDLAGFGVGMVEKKKLVDGSKIKPGDVVLGLESSGIHSNGYTLARAVFNKLKLSPGKRVKELGMTAGEALLAPTRIYVPLILDLMKKFTLKGMANITGGGLPGNLNRTLPAHCDAEIDTASWERPAVFRFMQEKGPVEEMEMFRSFNMGVGYCMVVAEKDAVPVMKRCEKLGFPVNRIGKIIPGEAKVQLI
jgi:phosphoribosylformylglycinamidine cyclo-ligase